MLLRNIMVHALCASAEHPIRTERSQKYLHVPCFFALVLSVVSATLATLAKGYFKIRSPGHDEQVADAKGSAGVQFV